MAACSFLCANPQNPNPLFLLQFKSFPPTMLCSIATQKSGSNWLDRLRSSKGFAVPDTHDESNSHSPHAQNELRGYNTGSESSSDPIQSVHEPVRRENEQQLCNAVSNVLSELFCMGESINFNTKKGSRKQTNPRFCAPESVHRKAQVASPMSDDNSRVDSQVKLLEQGYNLNLGEEDDKSNANMLGFSRTEVMVIDTSCAPWKFEKLLFRKKNVWKVRDKKSKTINLGKKKRKAHIEEGDVGSKKKHKVISGHDGCGSSKDAKLEVCEFPVNEKLRLNGKSEETCKRTSDSTGQIFRKRQGDLKLKKASSSVVLIKSIPTSKKSGTGIAKNSLKPSQR